VVAKEKGMEVFQDDDDDAHLIIKMMIPG